MRRDIDVYFFQHGCRDRRGGGPPLRGRRLTVYGIAYNGEALICFTEDRQAAEEAASLLNENSVEPCHATEIVEDSFIR